MQRHQETGSRQRLDELLDRWEDAVESGDHLTPEELCADCPELLDELRERVAGLQSFDQRFGVDQADDRTLTVGTGVDPAGGMPPAPQLPGGTLAATLEYTHLEPHAEGGLGVVFRGRDGRLNRDVAIKFIKDQYARLAPCQENFLREAEITGRLDHPGIVPVYGVGRTPDGKPFYAMRLIRGETLEDAIREYHERRRQASPGDRELRLEFRNLLTRFVSVCKTLAYAHNRGILHRDVKPGNVMIGRYGETLVVDWGLAIPVERSQRARESGEPTLLPQSHDQEERSQSADGAGTPAYMSPEQANCDEDIGPASDTYGLGAMLYKILTGRAPIEVKGRNLRDVTRDITEGRYPRPRQLDGQIPPAIEAVCLKAMAVEPGDRYSGAVALAEDVERFLADERVSAHEESTGEKARRWVRRHRSAARVGAVAVGVLALVLVGFSGWLAKFAHDAQMAETDAIASRERSLQVAARFAASTAAARINERWRILEIASNDPALRRLLADAKASPEVDWEALELWLRRCEEEHQPTAQAESWFVCDAEGRQLARMPPKDSIGNVYAHRDYFHGNGVDLPEGQRGDPPHIEHPHLSNVYESSTTGILKVAFSIPVWRQGPLPHEREFLGILGMSVALGKFGELSHELGDEQLAVLVDLDPDVLDGPLRRGIVLHHRDLESRPGMEKTRVPDELLERMQTLRRNRRDATKRHGRTEPLLVPDYRDPVDGNEDATWTAAIEPVLVESREGRLRDTGWVVVVQQQNP